MTTALITGITGQDGRYLAELLLARGYRVVGVARRAADADLPTGVVFHHADTRGVADLAALLREHAPDEVYHLAAETSVERSWDNPGAAKEGAQAGVEGLLDAIRRESPGTRVFLASSSEVFSATSISPQDEDTPLAPGSPYGEGKAAVLLAARAHRIAHGMHVSAAVLYNHESPRRTPRFVSRKVTQAVAAIAAGTEHELRLGNLEARRDWGYAGDYVEAMWLMLQAATPDDYVIGTGDSHTVRELCEVAFGRVGLDYRRHVVSDPSLFRPVDSVVLVANARRARERLGWAPRKPFAEMIHEMVDADVERLRRGEA